MSDSIAEHSTIGRATAISPAPQFEPGESGHPGEPGAPVLPPTSAGATGAARPTMRSRRQSGPTWLRRRVATDRSRELTKLAKTLYGLTGIVVVVALWQILASTNTINPLIYSSPWKVVQAARTLQDNGSLDTALVESAKLFGISFGIALAVGIIGGIIIGWYRRIGAIFDPLVSIVYAAPRIALVPVIIVAAGIGFQAQLITVVLTAVFPIMINVQTGVASADRNLIQVARGYLGTNLDVLRTVALPGAVPHIISGIRQGIAQALIGVVVAEYLIGSQGIGGLIVSAGQSLDDSSAFVGVIIMSLAALILTMALRWVERRLDHWRN
jgi:ABC-type nitrate/sulfonate/bicarbonate transport system permease component